MQKIGRVFLLLMQGQKVFEAKCPSLSSYVKYMTSMNRDVFCKMETTDYVRKMVKYKILGIPLCGQRKTRY